MTLHFPLVLCYYPYTEMLNTVVKSWIEELPYMFQQGYASSHMPKEWLAENFHDHVTLNMWNLTGWRNKHSQTSSLDLNPLYYYIWGIIDSPRTLRTYWKPLSSKWWPAKITSSEHIVTSEATSSGFIE